MKTVSDLVQLKEGDMPVASMDIGGARYIGLTKREYFAAMAMQGILGGILADSEIHEVTWTAIAKGAASMADALLKELEK